MSEMIKYNLRIYVRMSAGGGGSSVLTLSVKKRIAGIEGICEKYKNGLDDNDMVFKDLSPGHLLELLRALKDFDINQKEIEIDLAINSYTPKRSMTNNTVSLVQIKGGYADTDVNGRGLNHFPESINGKCSLQNIVFPPNPFMVNHLKISHEKQIIKANNGYFIATESAMDYFKILSRNSIISGKAMSLVGDRMKFNGLYWFMPKISNVNMVNINEGDKCKQCGRYQKYWEKRGENPVLESMHIATTKDVQYPISLMASWMGSLRCNCNNNQSVSRDMICATQEYKKMLKEKIYGLLDFDFILHDINDDYVATIYKESTEIFSNWKLPSMFNGSSEEGKV